MQADPNAVLTGAHYLDGDHASAEGGACLAATRRLRRAGWISPTDTVALFNTGHAFKYGP